MKLRNKKTGEVVDAQLGNHGDPSDGIIVVYGQNGEPREPHCKYHSLAEFNEEWEDYEESKEHWYITIDGDVRVEPENQYGEPNSMESIGNYFETEEDAEKAVEKLKAWKRLRDKGFRFEGWEDLLAEMDFDDLTLFNRDVLKTDSVIGFRMNDYHDCIKDLNLLFGGEE